MFLFLSKVERYVSIVKKEINNKKSQIKRLMVIAVMVVRARKNLYLSVFQSGQVTVAK